MQGVPEDHFKGKTKTVEDNGEGVGRTMVRGRGGEDNGEGEGVGKDNGECGEDNVEGREEGLDNVRLHSIPSTPGFNPVWNHTFQFVVHFPELAVLRMKVMDEDWGPNRDDFIGSFTLPFDSITQGKPEGMVVRAVHWTGCV